jgi:hypothetical protein
LRSGVREEDSVKAIRLAAVVAVIFVTATLIGSAGAGTGASAPTVDLSTNQAVMNYLTSLGIDPAGVVIQRGANNYAGPSCPGVGWTCTTSTKVVQVAQPGGQNQVACGAGANMIPDSYLTSTLTQTQINQLVTASATALPISSCVAVQGGSAQTNTVRCVMRDSTEPTATQNCPIVQPGTDGDPNASNRAFVLELIDQNVGPNQNGTQRSNIMQTALGGARNFAHVIQYVKQSTSAAGGQVQQEEQLSCAFQTSEAGNQFAQTIQSVAQKEQAKAGQDQSQNVGFGNETCDAEAAGNGSFTSSSANTFARVEQDSTSGGQLESHVNQSHNLDARTTNPTGGNQTQGNPGGGIEGKVFQDSTGLAKSFGVQNEDQNLVGNSPTITQQQFGPLTCCSTQTSNPNDDVQIDQMSSQRAVTSTSPLDDLVPAVANPTAFQQTLLEGDFQTSGSGDITHKAKQNEGSDTASCPPQGVSTEGGTTACSLTTFGVNGVFLPYVPD